VVSKIDPLDHVRLPIREVAEAKDIPSDFVLLITEDDMSIADLLPHPPVQIIGALATEDRSPKEMGVLPNRFALEALRGACGNSPIINNSAWSDKIIEACRRHQTKTVVTSYAPIGPVSTAITNAVPDLESAGIQILFLRRQFDTVSWPHATKGFFAMKKNIPSILATLGFKL
jgi:deoxyribodipyrimidine photo-lyase